MVCLCSFKTKQAKPPSILSDIYMEMAELMISQTSSSSTNLQQRLQLIVQSSLQWWSYAIFWRASTDSNGRLFLAWGDGHFQAAAEKKNIEGSGPKELGRRKLMRGIQAILADNPDLVDMDDAEWFYAMSLTRSFSAGEGVPGKALCSGSVVWLTGAHELLFHSCDRAKEAQLYGIQTLVCIPTSDGVVELGSSDAVGQNWSLIQQVKNLFGSDLKPPAAAISFIDQSFAGVQENNSSNHRPEKQADDLDSDCPFIAEKRVPRKRCRKEGPTHDTPVNHVEAERQRREKLNHRFYALRAVVPNVSRMDKASLLSDAVSYINELNSKISELELQLSRRGSSKKVKREEQAVEPTDNHSTTSSEDRPTLEVEVKIVGCDIAMVRVQSEDVNYPPARLMGALRDLELNVQHASMSSISNLMLQDAVVRIPVAFRTEDALKSAILARIVDQ